ncbi:MAG: CcmD family protein [Bacteroidota bacterium]|jgi:O-antigen/teichoic acid export membrane protein
MKIRSILTTLFCLLFVQSFSQETAVEMADTMRSNGKIYVVVGVLLVIFTGIVIYLIRLDRKISVMEKNRK